MQIVVNKDLSIAGIEPAEINRGSSNADFLSIFAPFSTKNFKSVLVYLELPNGEKLKPRVAFVNTNTDVWGIGLWSMPIDARLTEIPGKVKCQLGFIGLSEASNGEPIEKRTDEFFITVRDGIVPELPDTPTSDIYKDILRYLSVLNVDSGNISGESGLGGYSHLPLQRATNTLPVFSLQEVAPKVYRARVWKDVDDIYCSFGTKLAYMRCSNWVQLLPTYAERSKLRISIATVPIHKTNNVSTAIAWDVNVSFHKDSGRIDFYGEPENGYYIPSHDWYVEIEVDLNQNQCVIKAFQCDN